MPGVARAAAFALVVVFLAFFAHLIVPRSVDGKSVIVPPDRYLDATLAAFVVSDSVDKLVSDPRHFYDTAILYPDRTQLRSTEPFLGFALIALPLKSVFHLDDAALFALLRWLIVLAALVYGYLLFRAADVDILLSAAGAAACLAQPSLLNGISRLQILSIPLLLPVLYHALRVWSGARPRAGHAVALSAWTALYPLCGVINATVGVVALVLLLPFCVKVWLQLRREERLAALAGAIGVAVLVDAVALAPWLFDRADMRVYTSEAFLAVKRWTPTLVPLRAAQVPGFIADPAGFSVATALALMCVLLAIERGGRRVATANASQQPAPAPIVRTGIGLVPLLAVAMAACGSAGISRQQSPWLGIGYDAGCVAGLLLFWRGQWRLPPARERDAIARSIGVISGGLGVFLCLVSFGPVYGGNQHQLATRLTNVLLEAVPPMKAVREFDRLWIFGVLFLTIFAVVRIGRSVHSHAAVVRAAAATVVLTAACATVLSTPMTASPAIEAPKDLVALAGQSTRRGAIYVHPYMKWNSRSGVLMIAIARELKRPIVNGYLGVILPWFAYATEVLHRYPDPEALWLLRTWKVETVLRLGSEAQLEQLSAPFQPGDVVIEEIPASADLTHPSAAPGSTANERVEAQWTRLDRAGVSALAVKAPAGFRVAQIEIHFAPTPVAPVPASVDVYEVESAQRVRLNDGLAGQWLQSLAAAALVRREQPVATIRLARPASGDLELESAGTVDLPIERIVLIGSADVASGFSRTGIGSAP